MEKPATHRPTRSRGVALMLALVVLGGAGCATQNKNLSPAVAARAVAPVVSPAAEIVAPRDAWRLAEVYAEGHPGCEVLVGSGDSMLPLYCDRTVLVVERVAMSRLRVGMTVIFMGERGWPVAHTLFEKTPRGWRTLGLGNREPDASVVRQENYIGTVVKAYTPSARVAAMTVARGDADTRDEQGAVPVQRESLNLRPAFRVIARLGDE